ncbi:NAD-dependent epimerase/dehydratase family protein [Actinoplanes sp. NPDC049548]|uniref:NAD-dependent epimerase/dehydratase family protein n=1 Tax=Actinoplanes sp. NPDC049548 TaxID=3155152 RepID=UPI0034194109
MSIRTAVQVVACLRERDLLGGDDQPRGLDMKIVITGGAGFIGANLCRELLRRPEVTEVVAFDDLSTGSSSNLAGIPVELVEGSILDRRSVADVVSGAHAVVHLAARPSVPRSLADPVTTHNVNTTGTLHVLEACRECGANVVTASSSSVYGSVDHLPKHENLPTRPQSPYAASKLAAEAYTLAYAASFRLPALAFRFFNVYGPLQKAGHPYAAVIPAFIDAVMRRTPLRINGDGRQSRDFTYVGSVVDVLADAAVRRVTSRTPVNLAFGTRVSILELIDMLSTLMGEQPEISLAPARIGDVRASQASGVRLSELFPQSTPVPLEDGLVRTIEWFRSLPAYAEARLNAQIVAAS